ncbi:MAG: LysM peptidoglycan-binding domain-containing protein [Deltaproteobacteria bacterium]|nr:LysM peptidoglycan-binding domain-containing protein [Deltaproteobacteria bacterium]
MKKKLGHFHVIAGTVSLICCLAIALPPSGFCAVLYRSYVVKYDRGWDILCDPYIVQKNDWVYKIFRQKGEISRADFQEFLSIFKRLNPHIRDIDRIRPNQNILIPLKKLEPGTLPGQETGLVTIPFVTIAKISEILGSHATPYRVKQGDSVSKLIAARFGDYGSRSYREGLSLFKALNPGITNLDLIVSGKNILLPDPAMRNRPWYDSLFDAHGNIKNLSKETQQAKNERTQPVQAARRQPPPTPLSETASLLDARLMNKGTFFFPRSPQDGTTGANKPRGDFELDLSRYPVLEMDDGRHIVFRPGGDDEGLDMTAIRRGWQKVEVVSLPEKASTEQILGSLFQSRGEEPAQKTALSFSDKGLSVTVRAQWTKSKAVDNDGKVRYIAITMIESDRQRTPETIVRYLDERGIVIKELVKGGRESSESDTSGSGGSAKPDVATLKPTNQKTFIKSLVEALGYTYSENVSVTFPYAGIQVEAVSNLVTTGNGNDFLVDFGELYGDAALEIRKTGLGVVRISHQDSLDDAARKMLTTFDVPFAVDPLFIAAPRPSTFNTILKVPGYLVTRPGKHDELLSAVPLHNRILQFFNDRNVRVILTGINGQI